MTSKLQPRRCYVYITLPGETKGVTAGRYELTVNADGTGLGQFVYGRSYLARPDGVEIDPVELRLVSRLYETTLLGGVFGALRDAAPDYWGRLVIERALGKGRLTEIDYLLQSADDRAGALGFGLNEKPPSPMRQFNKTLHLNKLQATALALLKDKPMRGPEAEQVQKLMLLGTSMGGARPKAVVEDAEGLWIAKFNRPDDSWNSARVEHAMLSLAKDCGISVAESKVVPIARRDVLLVKRFDREKTSAGYLRHRMVSALTLLRSDDSVQDRAKWSYVLLAEELRRACEEPRKAAVELFRRMCFNALVSNTDDHPRNHAILAKDRAWKLSPAYDITPSRLVSIEHRDLAMAVGDLGRYASAQNLLSQCNRFLLGRSEAEAIVAQMETQVGNNWYSVARKSGVTVKDCEAIKGAFVYPGFSFALQVA
jgi:serine/threonine-protein kinase HipA